MLTSGTILYYIHIIGIEFWHTDKKITRHEGSRSLKQRHDTMVSVNPLKASIGLKYDHSDSQLGPIGITYLGPILEAILCVMRNHNRQYLLLKYKVRNEIMTRYLTICPSIYIIYSKMIIDPLRLCLLCTIKPIYYRLCCTTVNTARYISL